MCPEIIVTKPIDSKPTVQEHTDLGNFLKAQGATDIDVTEAIGLSTGQDRREVVERLRAWLKIRPKA